MYLESLFRYLKKNYQKGTISLTFSQIEEIMGKELCISAKMHDSYWNNPRIKRLMDKYNIRFNYINTFSRLIYFEIL